MKIDDEIKSGKRRTSISLTLWSSRKELRFPLQGMCGIVKTLNGRAPGLMTHELSTLDSLHPPAP